MSNSEPINLTPESSDLRSFQLAAQAQGRACVVSAIVVDQWNRAFVQRRSPSRRLFPGCWDVVGGHVEPGETLHQALAREVEEETGWHLECLLGMIESVDWEADHTDDQERV